MSNKNAATKQHNTHQKIELRRRRKEGRMLLTHLYNKVDSRPIKEKKNEEF